MIGCVQISLDNLMGRCFMNSNFKLPIIVFGAGLTEKGRFIDQETKNRCDRSVKLFRELEKIGKPTIILCAGWPDLWKGNPYQNESVAQMMKRYMKDAHTMPDEIFVLGPTVTGIKQEFRAGVCTALQNDGGLRFHLIASEWELIKLRFIAGRMQQGLSLSFPLSFVYVPS